MPILVVLFLGQLLGLVGCSHPGISPTDSKLVFPGEVNFSHLRQLTHEGTNAEAYWSFDGDWLTFQRKTDQMGCDQIFTMRADGSDLHRVSNGQGRTTCSYYFPNRSRILYASTFNASASCPATPDMSHGYLWPVYPTYQIYTAKPDGSDTLPLEPGAPTSYNAEGTLCHDGSLIFTSDRDGDLDLYTAKLDSFGTIAGAKRITNGLGYDGGGFFSADCKHIVWRASRPRAGKETKEYKKLLKAHLVRPSELEIWTANADGSHAKQVTRIGAASFAPFFTPDGDHIIFASNPRDPHGRKFDLYMVRQNGTGLRRITFSDTFESFPMFSPDGKKISFSSNRGSSPTLPHETDVFVADWAMTPDAPLSADDADPANRFQFTVEKLADPALEGREYGTKGFEEAAQWVAGRFRAIGLKPFFEVYHSEEGSGFFHPTTFKDRSSENVVGVLGARCGSVPPVVIGAHLDHLGHGGESSLEPSKTGIHPGADDNASGIAALLEVAGEISKNEKALKKSCFVFAAFTGEEIAIIGSTQLAALMVDKMKLKPKAMLNMDMVGRMENNRLLVFGTESAREFKAMVAASCAERRLDCPGGGDGYGPSDHMSFYIKKIPVLHFFTGPHADYHRTTDTPEKINATGGVQSAEVVADLAEKAAGATLHYVKASGKSLMGGLHLGEHGHMSKAYLGTIPDYSRLTSPHGPAGGGAEGGGVWLSGARPGSPADKAGVKEGDLLKSIDGHSIATLDEFMKVLVGLQPGQKVTLEVKRGESVLHLPAEVGTRD